MGQSAPTLRFMTMTPATTRRLALIRLLLDRATEAARQPVPYSMDAISRLHDVAEMWLALAVEQHNGKIPPDFMGYWSELGKALGRPLAYRTQMTRLNKARVNLKHFGIEPAASEIEAAAAAVRSLLTDETRDLFGIPLEDVALSSFVTSEAASKHLALADDAWNDDEHLRAMGELRMAFDAVIRDYVTTKSRGRDTIFSSISAIKRPFLRSRPTDRDPFQRKLAEWQSAVEDVLSRLDETSILTGLGIDLRRYGMFNILTPQVAVMMDRSTTIHGRADRRFTDEQFEFCRGFVVQTALHLGEFDYELDPDLLGSGNEFEVVRLAPPDAGDEPSLDEA